MDALVLTGALGIAPPVYPAGLKQYEYERLQRVVLNPPMEADEECWEDGHVATAFYNETLAAMAARYGAAAAPGLVEALRYLSAGRHELQTKVMDNIEAVDTWLASDYRILAMVHAMVKLFDLHAGLLALAPWQEAVMKRCRAVSSGEVWFEAYD